MSERTAAMNVPTMEALIRDRRTVRAFNNKELTQEVLLELLDIAVWAPNHKLREPWRFVSAITPDSRRRCAEMLLSSMTESKLYKLVPGKLKDAYRKKLEGVPGVLFVIAKEDKSKIKREEDFAATCALIQNLSLAAWERGIGMVWSIDEMICGNEGLKRKIGVRGDERIAGLLYMGYFDKRSKASSRTPAGKKMTWL